MTDLATIQSWPREQLESAFTQREDQLAKALEAEKLAHAGFDKAAAERNSLAKQSHEMRTLLRYVAYFRLPFGDTVFDKLDFERQKQVDDFSRPQTAHSAKPNYCIPGKGGYDP